MTLNSSDHQTDSTISRPTLVDSMLDLVGKTPMVRLSRLTPTERAEIIIKLESFNPSFSVKDRICHAMIESAEQEGKLKPGYTVVEPTSGNTGNGLAMVCAVKGYRLIVTMPEGMSVERQKQMSHYGAKVILTSARKAMQGAIDKAEEIIATNPNCFMPNQFVNKANIKIHRETTAREILKTLDGKIDAFVAGIGTGGTISGVGEVLKKETPGVLIVGVEPQKSAVISGGKKGLHSIQGLGAGFVPPLLNREIIDEIMCCEDQEAYHFSSKLAQEEGISAGMSAGAAAWAAMNLAQRLGLGKRVVTILPDAWERYLSLNLDDSLSKGSWDVMI